jgi:hypothetical protein
MRDGIDETTPYCSPKFTLHAASLAAYLSDDQLDAVMTTVLTQLTDASLKPEVLCGYVQTVGSIRCATASRPEMSACIYESWKVRDRQLVRWSVGYAVGCICLGVHAHI